MNEEKIILVYDQECPVCDKYSQMIRIRRDVGELVLINARDSSEIMDEITSNGLNIDQGMVVKMGNQLYFGVDAIHVLAMISSRSGIFNRVNHWFFKSITLSKIFYPLLRFSRNLLLATLGKNKINNLNND